jgi:hypothetical protein
VALGLTAVAVAVLQGLTGVSELALYAGPFLVIVGLLLSGRYVGEARILAYRRAGAPRLRAALKRPWRPVADRWVGSLLDRAPRSLRGPPAAVRAS